MFQPSTPSACPSHTQHACTCSKTHSQTHSLTTYNNSGPGKSRPGWIVQQEAWRPRFSPTPSIAAEDTQAVWSDLMSHRDQVLLVEGADEPWGRGKGKGRSLHRGAEERETEWVCVFGRRGAGRAFSSSHKQGQRDCGGDSSCQQRRQKAGTPVNTVPSQWNSKFCCGQRSSFGRFSLTLPTGNSLFLSPQGAAYSCPIAFFSDMDHSSFLSHALNEEGAPL